MVVVHTQRQRADETSLERLDREHGVELPERSEQFPSLELRHADARLGLRRSRTARRNTRPGMPRQRPARRCLMEPPIGAIAVINHVTLAQTLLGETAEAQGQCLCRCTSYFSNKPASLSPCAGAAAMQVLGWFSRRSFGGG